MLDFQKVILGLTILLNLFLAGIVVAKDFRNKVNIFFGSFVLSIIFWTLSMLMFRAVIGYSEAVFWLRLSYAAAGFIGVNFFAFCLAFTKAQLPKPIWALIIFVVSAMTAILFQPWFLIRFIFSYPWGRAATMEPLHYLLYSFYFILSFFGALFIIEIRYRKEVDIVRTRLRLLFWGVLIAGLCGTFLNLILPSPWVNEWRFIWLGPVFTLIFVFFITLAITKYHLLNIRTIAVELFTVAILVITGIQIFLSDTTLKFVLNSVIFGLLLVFGILLIRNVLNEVRRREEMERLTKQLEGANAQLKELDRAKTDFLSIASHQLRSPLTVVKVGTGALLDGTFGPVRPKRQREALGKIFESADRLIRLIGDYLNISRIELGKIEYRFAPADVCELARSIAEEYTPRAQAKGLSLGFSSDKSIREIVCDADKLREVINNLVDNAIKYTPSGSVKVHCGKVAPGDARLPEASRAQGGLIVSVRDTGMGLDKEGTQMIFQKFRRAAQSNFRRGDGEPVEGSGLGLYVAKMFIEAHGGSIWVESAGKGKGSVFAFAIPIKKK